MSSFSRFSAILFAFMLCFIGISRDQYEVVLSKAVQGTEIEQGSARFSEKSLNDVWGIQQQKEPVVSSISSLPAPASKIHPNNVLAGLFSLESRVWSLASGYLVQARKIYPSLSIRVIIFPFHHFL